MIRDVIFDFDGVIADTEELCYQANEHAFTECNLRFTREQYAQLWIIQGLDLEDIVENFQLTILPSLLRKRKNEYFAKLLEDVGFINGARETLGTLLSQNYRLSIASSNLRSNIELFLKKRKEIKKFSAIVGREDIKNPKPHSEVFLTTLEKLGAKKDSSVVIEDAPKGIIAAKEAGIKTIAIPNIWTQNADFSEADLVLQSIEEVPEAVRNLLS